MEAVQFGAGNIGRGFIGKILADAGWKVVFADVDTTVVGILSKERSYQVDVVGEMTRHEVVSGVDAVSSQGDDVIGLLKTADLVTTAVGPAVLSKIAPTLARGITARLAAGNHAPLNIIACENTIRGTTQLKNAILPLLPSELIPAVEAHIGFADSAVDRIVPPAPRQADQPLMVAVEEFSEWIVDRTQLRGWPHEIAGMELTDNLPAFIERKLFTLNTGHAVTAYLGFLKGCETIRDAITQPLIHDVVRGAMEESGAVLIRRYGFVPSQHLAYIGKVLGRFANPHLHDDVRRVGREPIRKLGKDDRLIRPLLGTLEFGVPHESLVKGIAAALCYRNDEDAQAVEMQRILAGDGAAAALAQFTQNALPAPVAEEIAAAWRVSQVQLSAARPSQLAME